MKNVTTSEERYYMTALEMIEDSACVLLDKHASPDRIARTVEALVEVAEVSIHPYDYNILIDRIKARISRA